MKLKDLFAQCIEHGMSADPRTKQQLDKMLKKETDRQAKLEGDEKEFADPERTWNPYSDSRIINGTGEEDITRVMVGIDIETPEVLLADRLREKGEKIDALFIHHPEGRGLADLEKVMPLQIDLLATVGIPVNHTEAQLKPRMGRLWRTIHADNLFRVERAAELLGIPAFTCHTPTDNLVWRFMEKNISEKNYETLEEVINALHEIPEYREYAKKGNPCIIAHGDPDGRAGKIAALDFTGGTNGPEDFVESQSRAGVGTILTMHMTEKEHEMAKKFHINYVQCSHMASDVIGINLMLDRINKKNKVETLDASGFMRVKRKSA